MFMCVRINPFEPENHGCPSFYKNIFDANRYAFDHAKTWIANIPEVGIFNKRITFCVCIFEIPFGTDIPLFNISFPNMDDEIWDYLVKIIWDRETSSAKLIQMFYRRHFERRKEATKIIQKWYRDAITNPYTELCRKRLFREFNEMNCF